jgi:thioredoxin-related protein
MTASGISDSMSKLLAILLYITLCISAEASSNPLKGLDLLSKKEFQLVFPSQQKTVLIFMSAKCPCSGSHEPLIKALAEQFKDFKFLAVHSNANESEAETNSHFRNANLGFPVIQDSGAQWADSYGALKTPHAFVLDKFGKILYQGGVTDSHVAPQSKTQFLKEVLQDLQDGKKPRRSEGRTLGCYIQREKE